MLYFPRVGNQLASPDGKCYKAIMRIVARKTLEMHAAEYPQTASSIRFWREIASSANWRCMDDVTQSFRNAKILNGDRVRFELSSGHRMIVSFSFAGPACWIKFIGTHKQYDAMDALQVSMF